MADNEAQDQGPGDETGQFPKHADYCIHILLEKAKGIKADGGTADPVFEIEALGATKYSAEKDDVGEVSEVVWNEHIFIEATGIDKRAAENGRITLKLFDKGLFKNDLVGLYEFDLSYIYLKEKHLLLHKWVALNNPGADNYAEICGYVKLSIQVTATGDESVQIKEDEAEREDPDILMSPSLRPVFYQVTIRLFQAQDLSPMDSGLLSKSKIDAYMRTNFKGKRLKTKALKLVQGGKPIDWNTEFLLPCQVPTVEPYINLRLMDEDNIADEMAGTIRLKVKDLLENEWMHGQFSWKNVYGSPLGQSGSAAKTLMNEDPSAATTWKGRVLIQTVVELNEAPVHKVQPINQDAIDEAQRYLHDREYHMIAQIGQAVSLPGTDHYSIRVTVGGHTVKFDPVKQRSPANYKRYGRCDVQKLKLPYVNGADLGKVIFQLMDKEDPICYYKAKVADFLTDRDLSDEDREKFADGPPLQWVEFRPDQCVDHVKDLHKAGIFSFRLEIHDVTKHGPWDFQSKKFWRQPVAKRFVPIKIRAQIFLCKDLPGQDKEGTSDAYIVCWDTLAQEKKTRVIEGNNNPLFYEVVELNYEVENPADPESYPPFIFDCYDRDSDLLDSTDDFIGRALIEPEDCALVTQKELEEANDDELQLTTEPRWHPFHPAPGEPTAGEVLVRFVVVEYDYAFKQSPQHVNLHEMVDTSEYNFSILVLGLRNLQSPGILPVKKAFINFKCSGIVPPGTASVRDIQTQPTSPGPNPTINTALTVKLPLPLNPLYCPNLQCCVHDQIFKGWHQPVIGSFQIDIGQHKQALIDERERETQAMDQVVQELKKIVANPSLAVPSYGGQADSSKQIAETQSEAGTVASTTRDQQKARQMYAKVLKHAENLGDLKQELGANEQEGNMIADAKRGIQIVEKVDKVEDSIRDQILQVEREREGDEAGGTRRRTTRRKRGERATKGAGSPVQASAPKLNKRETIHKLREADQIKRDVAHDLRRRALEEMHRQNDKGVQVIVTPQYAKDERLKVMREVNPPSDKAFIGVGFDDDPTTGRKHYRYYFPDELENDKEIFPRRSPFEYFELRRLKTPPTAGGFFRFTSPGKRQNKTVVDTTGYFKGIIQIESYQDRDAYRAKKKQLEEDLKKNVNQLSRLLLNEEMVIDVEKLSSAHEREKLQIQLRKLNLDHLHIAKHLVNLESEDILRRMIQSKSQQVVRVYVIEGFNLASRDRDSHSDPYLKLICNDQVYDERDNYQLDEPNPIFSKKFDFEGEFPGCAPLKIQVWDWDAIFSDELVGETLIDLEDRYFSIEWQNLEEKPVEYREIHHPSSSISQGQLKLWLEIIPADMKDSVKEWDISPKPAEEFEVRVSVLNCKDFIMDSTGMCDAYIRGFFDSAEEDQETDTHFRCQDGKPDFEYRMIFKVSVPRKDYTFHLQSYDRDFFKSNEMLGEASIDLEQLILDTQLVKKPLALNKKYLHEVMDQGLLDMNNTPKFDKDDHDKFWLKMMGKTEAGNIGCTGQVRIQVNVLPIKVAEKNPVGKARDSPNHSPALPAPEGRLELSINPLKMLNQFLGPAILRKIYMGICFGLCCLLLAMMFPMIVSSLIARLL